MDTSRFGRTEKMNYLFDTEHISQHIVKYGVHLHPPVSLKDEKARLQDYCNWLIEQCPQLFETLLLGPGQLRVQKNFAISGHRAATIPTFTLAGRGPVFAFPERLYVDEPQDIETPQKDRVFRKALEEFGARFPDRGVRRLGVVHELVFDTGSISSLEILASNLKSELWRQRAKNIQIRLETPAQGKNINIELRPTRAMRLTNLPGSEPGRHEAFGIVVTVDINNRQLKGNLDRAEINDILAFADDYVPEELIKFLNNEY